ncbi:MAG: hypothetical protein ABJB66_14845 [Gemmatimonadaceae bacterium]
MSILRRVSEKQSGANFSRRRDGTRVSSRRKSRGGRALVECIVAALLLSVTGLSLAATARGTLAEADDSQLISRGQALTTTRVEDALSNNCTLAASGSDVAPRIDVLWRQSAGARSTTLHADVTLNRSPIGFASNTDMLMSIEAGGVCQ